MKLGSLKSHLSRDGELVVVSKDLTHFVRVPQVAPSFRAAIEDWERACPQLQTISQELNAGKLNAAEKVEWSQFHSAMPRTFQWADGSAFIHHIKLVRMARNAPLPETLETRPLLYQGSGDDFLAPLEDIPQIDFSHGTDFEGEVAVILKDTPMGIDAESALDHILFVVLVNDVSLRGLIPEELQQGFGFFQGKPSSALSPVAVTLDELGQDWKQGRLHLPLQVELNGEFFGRANAGEMHFHFGQLIAHAARTRNLTAGTIIGSGTVSNENPEVGSSCLAEKRMIEKIQDGAIRTPFMREGDVVKMWMVNEDGQDIFGVIEQKVKKVTTKKV